MSDPSSEEARERLLVESLLKLSGEHSVTHHEPLQPNQRIQGKVGGAVTVWKNHQEVRKSTFRLENYCSVYQAELTAILRALELMHKHKDLRKGIILSDSRSALECLSDTSSLHPLAVEIRDRIKSLLDKGGEVNLCWIKAHIGIAGNERADELAKYAALSNKQTPVYDKFPLSFAKRLARDSTCVEWQLRYSEATTGAVTKKFLPDIKEAYRTLKHIKIDNLKVQLLTGHGGFRAYLYKCKLAQSPSCVCSNDEEENIEHLLIDCPRFAIQRLECEQKMGMMLTVYNLRHAINNDDCRTHFLKFSEAVVRTAGKANGSKLV
ncbi:unnamed protein product [Parnassius mnemosyne]|uniref:RNase H type-1 domain-containing protein n=1 Tax=Parnassius mnemosyne TaxID=213953 RepID=A0AAV1M564_9NEOP